MNKIRIRLDNPLIPYRFRTNILVEKNSPEHLEAVAHNEKRRVSGSANIYIIEEQ